MPLLERIRFTATEQLVRREAKLKLQDPSTSAAGRGHALAAIKRVEDAATARLVARRARQKLGPPPRAENFTDGPSYQVAKEKYRQQLDALAAGKILDDPGASLLQRETARRKLDKLPTVVEHVNATTSSHHTRKDYRPPGEKERAIKFLDTLEEELING